MDPTARNKLVAKLTQGFSNAGVPPAKIQQCVESTIKVIMDDRAHDIVASIVDKRINKYKPHIDKLVEERIEKAVHQYMNKVGVSDLVVKEAEKVARGLFQFMFEGGKKP